jgi:hypothetical protein
VLEEDPALAVDDRLGQARRPRAEEQPQRVVEGHLLEGQRLVAGHEIRRPAAAVEVAEAHDRGADLLGDAGDDLAAVVVAPAVAVAVDGKEHLGLDLREAVDDRARAELGRGARPHRADRGGGQEGGDRLGDVRHVGGHPVAGTDAHAPQPAGDAGGLLAQLAPRPLRQLAQLAGVADGHRVVVARAEEVLGVGQPRPREPLRAGHLAPSEHALVRLGGLHVEELPDRGPEALEVVDRPAPQLVVVALATDRAREAGDGRVLDALGGRTPQQLGLHG